MSSPPAAPDVRPYRSQRALDWAVLIVTAAPALAIGAICALAVRLTSGAPVLYRQERVGAGERPFTMLKFRTMLHGDNPVLPEQSRITRIGRILRRTSLDELPQLLNVAKGDMSIVGPRPTLAYQVARYDDRQRHRLAVRPGLTGLAQVSGRNRLPWAERIEHDLDYVSRRSLGLDLRILVRTVGTLLHPAGVGGHPVDDPIVAADPVQADETEQPTSYSADA